MIKLIIKEKNNFQYTLIDNKNNEYKTNIEIYDFNINLKIGDLLYINDKLLKRLNNQMISFGKLDGKYGKEIISEEDEDVVLFIVDNIKYPMKVYYG